MREGHPLKKKICLNTQNCALQWKFNGKLNASRCLIHANHKNWNTVHNFSYWLTYKERGGGGRKHQYFSTSPTPIYQQKKKQLPSIFHTWFGWYTMEMMHSWTSPSSVHAHNWFEWSHKYSCHANLMHTQECIISLHALLHSTSNNKA